MDPRLYCRDDPTCATPAKYSSSLPLPLTATPLPGRFLGPMDVPAHPARKQSAVDLPAEVLLHIFQYCIGPRRENGQNPGHEGWVERREGPIILSHTCSWWRSLTLSSPSLWTDVLIDSNEEIWFSYLERSRPLYAHLTIIADEGNSQKLGILGLFYRKFSESREDLRRVRSITLLVHNEEDEAAEMLRPFEGVIGEIDIDPNPLPSLFSLDIRASQPSARGRLGHSTHSSFSIFPSPLKALESVSLTGICPKCVPNRDALRTLEIRRTWSRLLLSSQILRDLFRSSPRLETLILGPIETHQWGESDGEPILAPSLKNLIVAWPSTPRWAPADTFSPLDDLVAENLEYLEVVCPTLEAIDHLQTVILQRLGQDGGNQPLTLMIGGLALLSHHEYFEQFRSYLPIHIRPSLDLRVYQRSMLCMEVTHYQDLKESVRELQSFVLYFDTELEDSAQNPLACVPLEMRRLPCRRGFIPVVIHAVTDDNASLERLEMDFQWPYFDSVAVKELAEESTEIRWHSRAFDLDMS